MGEKGSAIKHRENILASVLMTPEISMLIVVVILCIYTSTVNKAFFAVTNIQIIIRSCAFIGSLAIGEAFALMCGEIDLSVGTNSAFSSIIFASFAITYGWNPVISIIAGILAGTLIGVINAVLTLKLGMSSWIVTLSTMYVCKGLTTVISKGRAIASLKGGFKTFSAARPLGLSWMFFIMLAILLIAYVVMQFTPVGRKVHAVGINPAASRIAGINVKKVKALCLIFSGTMAGVCGILQSISNLSGSPTTGIGNEFPAIICCAIGGVSTSGGKGTMIGVLVGVIMCQTLKNCLQTLHLNNNMQLVVTGIILLAAVSFDIIKKNMRMNIVK